MGSLASVPPPKGGVRRAEVAFLDLCQLQVKMCFFFPVPLSSRILPGSAHHWGGPPHGGRGGPALPGLRWQPERKGHSKQLPSCVFDARLNTVVEGAALALSSRVNNK